MRTVFAVFIVLSLAHTAAGQSRIPKSDPLPPLPSIGLPLPPIGLPLPPMGLPPVPSAGARAGRFERPERFERSERPERSERSERFGRQRGGAVFLYVPTYGWPYFQGAPYPSLPTPQAEEEVPTGHLHLTLQPGIDPQLFVDEYYAGLLSDSGGELTLDAGPHVIEMRQDGYEPLRVDVSITGGGLVTYRDELRPIASAAPPEMPAAAPPEIPPPTTIYVIPGCYVGNVPPASAKLPSTCDPRRAYTFPSR